MNNTYPNSYVCEGCESWDDVNGCWQNFKEWCGEDHLDKLDKLEEDAEAYYL